MSNDITQKKNPALAFRDTASKIAGSLLTSWVGEERAKEATGRLAVSLASSAAAAKDPNEFYACTPQSVATAIATAALTGIMPGIGASALAYVIPQRARKGEPPQLQYMLSHRGLNALALRCGQQMIAVPIGQNDRLDVSADGDVIMRDRDLDNPPTTYDELRGVIVIVRRIDSGQVIASQFVPKKLIDARKAMSRAATSTYGPWHNWPVEMAMKTAMHYAISRGWCVVDDTEATRALSTEQDSDLLPQAPAGLIDVESIDPGLSKSERVAAAMKAKTQPEAEPDTVDAHQAAITRYEAKIAAAADVDTLTTIFESIEQAELPELSVERLHQLCVERQDALAAVPA